MDNSLIKRQDAIDIVTFECGEWKGLAKEIAKQINALPTAQPIYTDEQIQKMQDLEQAQIEKAYQLGYEEGKRDGKSERKMGKWIYDGDCYICNQCKSAFSWWADSQTSNYCPNCGADMRGEQDEAD